VDSSSIECEYCSKSSWRKVLLPQLTASCFHIGSNDSTGTDQNSKEQLYVQAYRIQNEEYTPQDENHRDKWNVFPKPHQ
jgi:hypothetical protein